MAKIDLNNFTNPKKIFNTTTDVERLVDETSPLYVDLHLDLKYRNSVGLGLNSVHGADILVDTDLNAIKNSIKNIFTTKKGQKILNPDFGSSLDQYLFLPITETNAKIMGNDILNTILKYEPRITITKVLVKASVDRQLYYISVYYYLNDIKRQEIIDIIAEYGGYISFGT